MSFHWQRFAGGVFGLYFWAQCSQDSLTALQGGGRKWKFGAFGEPVLLFITVLFISLTNKKITIRIFNLRSWGQDVFFFFFLNVIPKKAENSFCFLEIKVLFCFFTVQWQWRCTIHLYCINATWRFVSTLSYHLRSFLVHHCFILSN